MDEFLQGALDVPPASELSVGRLSQLRCNGAEVSGLLSIEMHDDGLLRLVFSERPDLGKRGRVVDLEVCRFDGMTRRLFGVLGAVNAEPAVDGLTHFRATIRRKRSTRRT